MRGLQLAAISLICGCTPQQQPLPQAAPEDPSRRTDKLENLSLPSLARAPSIRPIENLDVLAEDHTQMRWTELADGTFIPFAPPDPALFGLTAAFDTATLPAELRGCEPLRGLRSMIVFHCDNRRPGSRFVAMERATQAIRWRVPYPDAEHKSPPFFGRHGMVLEAGGDETIAYTWATGQVLWRRSQGGASRVIIDDPGIYLLTRGRVHPELVGLDPASGEQVWSKSRYCGLVAGAAIAIEDARGIHRIDVRTGALVATLGPASESCQTGHVRERPARLAEDRVFDLLPGDSIAFPTLQVSRLSTGQVLWRRPKIHLQFAVDADAVYVIDDERTLLALDPETGEARVELSVDYTPEGPQPYAAGGAFAPLITLRSTNGTTTLGRVESATVPEAYTLRGRIVPSDAVSGLHLHLDEEIRIGPHALFPGSDGRFTVHGRRTVGARLEVHSREYAVTATSVTLDGRGTYEIGDIPARPYAHARSD